MTPETFPTPERPDRGVERLRLPGLAMAKESAGLPWRYLANLAGVPYNYVKSYARGTASAPREVAERLAATLGVTVEVLEGKHE
jgi:predicted transcriptional regulator